MGGLPGPRHRAAHVAAVMALVASLLLPTVPGIPFHGRSSLQASPLPGVRESPGAVWRAAGSLTTILSGEWMNLTPNLTSSPPPRAAQSMADDPLLHAIVLFGGNDPSSGGEYGDTWEFVNGSWTDLTSKLATAPSARWGAGLAYDPAYKGLILFGGRNAGSSGNWIFNDTWLFNSTGWHNLSIANAPSPRTPYGSLVYDATDSYLLLFGGNYDNTYRYNDTWSFKNGTWTDLTKTLASAPPKAGFSAAPDATDGYDLFFGGAEWSGGNFGQTWSFANGSWTNRTGTSGTAPPMTTGSDAMSYDPVDRGVVLSSGQDDSYTDLNYTYVYSGGNWTNVSSSVGLPPAARWTGSLAYDAKLGGDLQFGGNEGNSYAYNDTWEFGHPFRVAAAQSVAVGVAPLNVTFTSLAGPGTAPIAYRWSFGDGSPNGTMENVTHQFASSGAFTIHLNARDSAGHSANTSLTLRVYAALALTATVGPAAIDATLAVAFRSLATGGVPPLRVSWLFGDGASSTSGNVTHAYALAGTYAWSLTAVDSGGRTLARYGNVTVYPTLVISTTTSGVKGAIPLNATFSAMVSAGDPPYALNWSFGDGATAGNVSRATHTYTSVGTFDASLTVSDAGLGRTVVSFPVDAVAPVGLTALVTPLVGHVPIPVQYSVTPSGGKSPFGVNWTFGRLGTSSSPSGSFTFSTPGIYPVNLTVVDAYGDRATRTFTVVAVAPLAATLDLSAAKGLTPLNVTLTAVTVGGVPPLSVVWTFGDGVGLTGPPSVSHIYANPGTFTARAFVTSSDGESATATSAVAVAAPPLLTVSSNLTNVTLGDSIALSAQVSGGFPAWSYAWTSLPTGCSPANSAMIDCTPTAAGRYSIHLTATDSFGDVRTAGTNVSVVASVPPRAPAFLGLSVLELALIGVIVAAVVASAGVFLARRRAPPLPPDEPAPAGLDPEAEGLPPEG